MAQAGGLVLCALGLVAALLYSACAKGLVHPSDTVPIPRQLVIQARGQSAAIYKRVRALEQAACKRGQITPAQCAQSADLDEQWQRDQRQIDAVLAVPGYEVDWAKLLTTLERVGAIVDKLPVP